MNDQTRISNPALQALHYHVSGAIERGEAEPIVEQRTWDGEPLWSPETVRESLFEREAFEQLKGQTTFHPELVTCDVCNGDGAPCKECRGTGTILQTTTDNDY